MEKKDWDNAQQLVNEGKGHLVKDIYIDELKSRLNTEQLNQLEDLSILVDRMMNDDLKLNMELKINYVIGLFR